MRDNNFHRLSSDVTMQRAGAPHCDILTESLLHSQIVPHALAAMDAIDTALPDVVVLDVLLPGPNAFAFLHELRSHPDLAGIPVVLCTNSADQIASEDVAAYGVARVLDKTTMVPGDLVAAVKKALPYDN